jgi:hypothetical protein
MFIVTRFSKTNDTWYGGNVEGMTNNYDKAKEMLFKLDTLQKAKRQDEKSEWTDKFIITHSIDPVSFTAYSLSYKEIMEDK